MSTFAPSSQIAALLSSWHRSWFWATNYDQGIVYRSKYQLQSVRNNGTNVGILQSLHQVDPTKVHTETERTPQASLSWPIESIWGWSWQSPGSHYYQWQDVVSLPWAAVKIAAHGGGHVKFPSKKWFKTRPLVSKVKFAVFWDRIGVILVDLLNKPSTLTTASWHWLSWRIKLPSHPREDSPSLVTEQCQTP